MAKKYKKRENNDVQEGQRERRMVVYRPDSNGNGKAFQLIKPFNTGGWFADGKTANAAGVYDAFAEYDLWFDPLAIGPFNNYLDKNPERKADLTLRGLTIRVLSDLG